MSQETGKKPMPRRRRIALRAGALAGALGLLGGGIAMAAPIYQSAGYTDQQRFVTETAAWGGAGTTWTNVPGMSTSVTIPSSGRVLNARYTAESVCGSINTATSDWCSVRVVYQKSGGAITEMRPADGYDFAFDSPGDNWESQAIERSTTRLTGGTYRVWVQAARVSGASSFRLDDQHFYVGTAL